MHIQSQVQDDMHIQTHVHLQDKPFKLSHIQADMQA